MSLTRCVNPIANDALTDYWLAALNPQEEERVDEHLLECDECGSRLRELIAIAGAVRNLARKGNLGLIIPEQFLRHAAAEGLQIREYSLKPGDSVNCTVTSQDDLLIGRLTADLSGIERVDFCVHDDAGKEQMRLQDIPIQSTAGEVIFSQPIERARLVKEVVVVRLVAVEEGGDRLVGQYRFNHTPGE